MSDLRSRIKPKRTLLKALLATSLLVGFGLIAFDLFGAGGASYLVAREQLLPGDPLTSANTQVVHAELGQVAAPYFATGSKLASALADGKLFATRPVDRGELLPKSATSSLRPNSLATIAVEFESALSRSIQPGERVDLYATELLAGSQVSTTRLIATSAWIRAIENRESVGRTLPVVEIALNRTFLEDVLAAVARSDKLALVVRSNVG